MRNFGAKGHAVAEDKPQAPRQGVAHVPSTVLTVEYVDDGPGMDAALKRIDARVQQIEERLSALQENQIKLVGVINQQAKDIGRYMESLGRRLDHIYKRVLGTEYSSNHGEEAAASALRRGGEESTTAPPEDALTTATSGLAADVAGDADHQNAWRIARVLAADLEAYHEDSVKEGVLYGTFYKVLREPIEKARKTYEERVPQEIVENYDYFSKALDELIARKRLELDASATA